jgi:MtN3 and saliva related transmembrane protein
MALLDYAGYAAALCTTGAYIPQVLKVWRTRATQDISLKMFLVLVTGLSLWLTYGIHKGEWPLIAANSITLCLASVILYFKLQQVRRDRNGSRVASSHIGDSRQVGEEGQRSRGQREIVA